MRPADVLEHQDDVNAGLLTKAYHGDPQSANIIKQLSALPRDHAQFVTHVGTMYMGTRGGGPNSGGSNADAAITADQVILPTASAVSNEGRSSPLLVLVPAVSWPWVLAWGSLEPPRRDGENAQKTGKNGGKMGEIRSKECEPRELTKDQLGRRTTARAARTRKGSRPRR